MHILAPIVPLLLFLLLWGLCFKSQNNWRASFLSAAVVWGVLLTTLTEILSLFKLISFWPLLAAWSFCLIAVTLYWIRAIGNPRNLFTNFRFPEASGTEIFFGSGIALITGIVGLIAWIAPPNTSDSMTYHMARVMHWIQDQSVADYPTHILRQLYLNPGSEFIILHLQILSGADYLANSVQWFSMVGSVIGVSLIADQLGADQRGQIFSAVVSITIPMGILQGSSTLNDYTVAFWLVCFVYWIFELKSKGNPRTALAAGAGLGLAILTKATTYFYAFPFLIWLGLSIIKTYRGKGAQLLGIVALMVIAINLGHYTRNYDLFSNPLGLNQETPIGHYTLNYEASNAVFSLPEVISNMVRNTAMQLSTPFVSVNLELEKGIALLHNLIGISPNDPRTTWPGATFQINSNPFDEASSGNLIHTLLIIATIILVLFQLDHKSEKKKYILSLLAAFLFFSFYLRWQPFQNRLLLSLFVLWSAIIGTTISGLQKRWIADMIIIALLIGALPWLFFNESRPLIGNQNIFNTSRAKQYFTREVFGEAYTSYRDSAKQLATSTPQCKQVGLYLDANDWEYPFWVLLQRDIGKDVRIESVNVENVSAREYSQFPEFSPCAILAISYQAGNTIKVEDTTYLKTWRSSRVSIFVPK